MLLVFVIVIVSAGVIVIVVIVIVDCCNDGRGYDVCINSDTIKATLLSLLLLLLIVIDIHVIVSFNCCFLLFPFLFYGNILTLQ